MTDKDNGKGTPWGHARAPMVLGPFAETKEPVLSLSKEPRRAGAKSRMKPAPRLLALRGRLDCANFISARR